MKRSILIMVLVIITLTPGIGLSQQQKNYDATITVKIKDRDTVFARNNAFQTLKRQILIDAIKDQIDIVLYEEHARKIFRSKNIKPGELVSAYQIMQEYTIGEKFTMKLQGTIRLDLLKEALRKLNLVLTDDPWYPITLITQQGIDIPIDKLQEKLDVLRIKITRQYQINAHETDDTDIEGKDYIENLFSLYPDNQILFLVTPEIEMETGNVSGVSIKIYRKTDLHLINRFLVKFKSPATMIEFDKKFDANKNRFLSAFSIQSCKRFLYDVGLESFIDIEVSGLTSSHERFEFEKRVINQSQAIESFKLKSVSREYTEYELFSKYPLERLISYFDAFKNGFDLFVEKNEDNRLNIYAVYKFEREIVELDSWPFSNRRIENINKILNDSESGEIDENLIPEIEEKEPNNNSLKINFLPNETLLFGKISSRADEDIYRVEVTEENKSAIIIEWMIASKTSLSPQLKLYDSDFRFLNSYSMLGNQKKLKFSYTFQDKTPKKIYIRVSDSVGFIQGETGGYKSYDYLLKVGWAD